MSKKETVIFNVGGRIFEIGKGLIQQYPESVLFHEMQRTSSSATNPATIFLDHNPEAFSVILDYIRYNNNGGQIFVPRGVAKQVVVLQLEALGLLPKCQNVSILDQDPPTLKEKGANSNPSTSSDNPPPYSSKDEKGKKAASIAKEHADLAITSLVNDTISPHIVSCSFEGITAATILLVPERSPQLLKSQIASTFVSNDPHVILAHVPPSRLEPVLIQDPHHIEKIVLQTCGIRGAVFEAKDVTVRWENTFGLLESGQIKAGRLQLRIA